MEDCKHIEKKINEFGEYVERPWQNIFCPDCGLRLVHDYKAEAFKLQSR
jgi:methionine synthase II (cobalamin-independent)